MATYDSAAKFFGDSAHTEGTAILSFTQIEGLMGKALLMSARRRRPWWGNDSYHVQSVARQAAGLCVFNVDMARRVVTSMRVA